MSVPFSDAAVSTGIWIIVKASVLLAAMALAHVLMRRRASAAARHWVSTLAVVGLLLLPLLSAVVHGWSVAIPLASIAEVQSRQAYPTEAWQEAFAPNSGPAVASFVGVDPVESGRPSPPVRSIPWTTALPALYAAGVIFLLTRQAAERLVARQLVRDAIEVCDPEWTSLLAKCAQTTGMERPIRLLRSRDGVMPMAFGTWTPAILVPATADTWTEDRRRAVLLHELAHIARYDCLTQMTAAVACALYWIHPGVWWVARRLRVERELACDDHVLAVGTQAREYAGHLLEIAHSLGTTRAPALGVSMARPGQLEGRLLAVLDAGRNRAVPTRRSRLAGMAVGVALLLPVAGARAAGVPAGLADVAGERSDASAAVRSAEPEARVTGTVQSTGLPGTWEIQPAREAGFVRLKLTDGHSSSSTTIPLERLEGLSQAQLSGSAAPTHFSSRRDAGTFTFDGVCRSGVCAGTFSFTASTTFPAELGRRGLARPTERDQYELARGDIGLAFVDEIGAQGYQRPDIRELVRAGQHGVSLDSLREMGRMGYHVGRVETLVTLQDHGVTPSFIHELATLGLADLPPDQLVRLRDHGVSPDYIRELRQLGYGSLGVDALVSTVDHGVDAKFVRDLDALGYHQVTLDALISTRDHGISPEFVRALQELGYHPSLAELTTAQDHGVDAKFIRELGALGYRNLSLESLIRLRDHGVTPQWVRKLKDRGYDHLDIDDLVRLRDGGGSPDGLKTLMARWMK